MRGPGTIERRRDGRKYKKEEEIERFEGGEKDCKEISIGRRFEFKV
jgi:hypothetical protein